MYNEIKFILLLNAFSMQLGRMKMFLIVFLVTILGYGLFMTALLHPEASLDWTVLFHILFRPSLVLIGEPGIESFQRKNLIKLILLQCLRALYNLDQYTSY